jgi:CBS domain-containing protein
MRTIDAVRRPGTSIDGGRTIAAAAGLMESAGVGTLAVTDGDELVGIVTDRDLVCRGLARGLAPDARIDSVMTMPVETVDADDDLHDTIRAFEGRPIRRLAVVDGGRFVGMISVDDLLIDLVSDLGALLRPVTAEVLFPHHDPSVPARMPAPEA